MILPCDVACLRCSPHQRILAQTQSESALFCSKLVKTGFLFLNTGPCNVCFYLLLLWCFLYAYVSTCLWTAETLNQENPVDQITIKKPEVWTGCLCVLFPKAKIWRSRCVALERGGALFEVVGPRSIVSLPGLQDDPLSTSYSQKACPVRREKVDKEEHEA